MDVTLIIALFIGFLTLAALFLLLAAAAAGKDNVIKKCKSTEAVYSLPKIVWDILWDYIEKPKELYDKLYDFMMYKGGKLRKPIRISKEDKIKFGYEKTRIENNIEGGRKIITLLLLCACLYFLSLAILLGVDLAFSDFPGQSKNTTKARVLFELLRGNEWFLLIAFPALFGIIIAIVIKLRLSVSKFVYAGTSKLLDLL